MDRTQGMDDAEIPRRAPAGLADGVVRACLYAFVGIPVIVVLIQIAWLWRAFVLIGIIVAGIAALVVRSRRSVVR